jgi:hypothetical protein
MLNLLITGQSILQQTLVHLKLFMGLPHTPMDLLPLPLQEQVNLDATKRLDFIKRLHAETRKNIEKKSAQYAKQANKGKKVTFQLGDLVWLHLRKDRFPQQHKSKLSPRGDVQFKVLQQINDNAYKLELPPEYSNVSTTFNVKDLLPFACLSRGRLLLKRGRLILISK